MRRPQIVAVPRTARPSAPDATYVARVVLDMHDAHALDQRIDRLLVRIVAGLQANDAPPGSTWTRRTTASV
ncbi:MAG TPA: hypothetical protein VFW74_15750 [Acidimicrobiia bacterium]|nr:hypothetical protein [Acidimicrobiia bacterium]